MEVSRLRNSEKVCEEYVRRTSEAKICHLPAWGEMIRRTFGHEIYYLVSRQEEQVSGILPLVHVRSRLFGNRMVSQGYSDYGGPLSERSDALDALYKRAVELATERGCESVEFRNVQPIPYDTQRRTDKVTMHLSLPAEPEELWRSFRSEIRNRVRKAENSGLVVISGGMELLDDFYSVWTVRMHQLGTPCYPRSLMWNILETFPDNSRVFLVRRGEMTLGGGLTTYFNGLVDMQFVATLVQFNKLAANVLLYWSVLKHFCETGASKFDFGRCTIGSPTYEFKRRWRPEVVELNYQYWVKPGHHLSLVSQDNPKFEKYVAMWRILPLWLTRLMGPLISRSLP